MHYKRKIVKQGTALAITEIKLSWYNAMTMHKPAKLITYLIPICKTIHTGIICIRNETNWNIRITQKAILIALPYNMPVCDNCGKFLTEFGRITFNSIFINVSVTANRIWILQWITQLEV